MLTSLLQSLHILDFKHQAIFKLPVRAFGPTRHSRVPFARIVTREVYVHENSGFQNAAECTCSCDTANMSVAACKKILPTCLTAFWRNPSSCGILSTKKMSRIIGAVALAVLALVSVPIYNLIDKGKPFHDLQQA